MERRTETEWQDLKSYCTAQVSVPKYGREWSFCFKEMQENTQGRLCCDKHGVASDNMLALQQN